MTVQPSYLLDTNILSDLIRRPQGKVFSRMRDVGESTICTSIVVAGELRYGAEKASSKALIQRIDQLLSAIEILRLSEPADRRYAELRHYLTSKGQIIGPNDMLIAAQCLAEKLTLVTANTREFSRVPGLSVENWLQE